MLLNELFHDACTPAKQVSELYNPEVFQRGFEQERQYGPYRLLAHHGQLPWLGHGKTARASDQFRVEAWKGKILVGWVNFEVVDDHLEAIDVVVDKKHRRRGIATAMYQLAKSLGNDIQRSAKQTGMGREFWATKSPVDEEQLDELSFLGSQCTKDCSGHRAGYEWYKRKGRAPMSWSPSFNKGAALAQAGK
jgi:GNAT superfamily N-acetyltransferase